MPIDENTKLRDGDIVSIQGKVELTYGEGDSARVVFNPEGYYTTISVHRKHLTFVRPFLEPGMKVYHDDGPVITVDAVLGNKWVVGRAHEDARPVTYSIDNVSIWEEDEKPLFPPLEPPPAPPEADPELQDMHKRAAEWPDTREPEHPHATGEAAAWEKRATEEAEEMEPRRTVGPL